ncbi:MAG TPA: histidine kinase [Usitatibacter sp.]|nr:histidine kinase [Usitatibacter sp.]
MDSSLPSEKTGGIGLMFGWRRFAVALLCAGCMGSLVGMSFVIPTWMVLVRAAIIGLACMLAYGIFEQWPERLPGWLARWALQVGAVATAVPLTVLAIYLSLTAAGEPRFWHDPGRLSGFFTLTFGGLLLGPWVAIAALFRKTELAARHQAMVFQLEKSELERKALDARLRLLQAQVEPHFLFNTLANVRELVLAGSPRAATVLENLITYLRAALPRLHDPLTTLGQELQLVRAYLELMHMRMPDRLQFDVQADAATLDLRCPPTTLLTLVENAVRHGIDPSEQGGRIDVRTQLRDGRCLVEVRDTGAGLRNASQGLGTGLETLRERLQLVFGGDTHLTLSAIEPHGASAKVDFPARREGA